MNKEIKITVKMKTKNMYEFMLRHFYTSIAGWGGVILSIVALVYLILNFQTVTDGKRILLIFAALLFTVINPLSLYMKAAKQVKLVPMFCEELTYIFNEGGITVQQHEEELLIQWNEINKIVETKHNLIIYITKVRAFVLPKEDMSEQLEEIRTIIRERKTGALGEKK